MTKDHHHPHLNGDASGPSPDDERPTPAQAIMGDPATAAGIEALTEQPPVLTSPHIQQPGTAKLLNDLPGLVGAIDRAIKDTAGKPLAFMLVVFCPGEGAMHATNGDAQQMTAAMLEWADHMRAGENEDATLHAANDSKG